VDSTCVGFKYLVCYISKGGNGSLGAPPVVTSDNGGFIGYEIVPYSAHGSAFPTSANGFDNSVASGPRAGWLIILEGDVESGDTLTLTMEQDCEEWAIYLVDEAGAGGITHVVPTTSLANSTAFDLHHQALTNASSGIRGLVWTGGGDDEPIPDGDEDGELASWAYNPGISGGSLVYKDGAFPGHLLQWTWTDPWSEQGMAWEVYPSGGDGGSPVRVEQITNQTDASGPATIPSGGSFTPNDGDVIVLVSTYEQGTLGNHSVTDTQGSPATYTTVTDGSTDASVDPDSTHRTVIKAKRYAASPGAIQVSFNGAGSVLGSVHSLFRVVGTDGSTDTDWVEQVDVATDDAATSIAGSLATLAATSGVLTVVSADASTEDIDFEDGFVPLTEQDSLGVGVENEAQHVVWLAGDEDTSPSFSVSGSARDLALIALEVLAAPAFQVVTAAAHGRVRVRASASGTRFAIAQSVGRVRVRSAAAGTRITSVAASGRARLRSAAQGTRVVPATAAGRVRVRSQAFGFTVAQAVGRVRVRSRATASVVALAVARGRVRVRATAAGTRITSAQASGRVRVRSTARSTFVLAATRGHARLRSTASALVRVTAAASGRTRLRSTSDASVVVAGVVTAAARGYLRVRSTASSSVTAIAAARGRVRLYVRVSVANVVQAVATGRLRVRAIAAGTRITQAVAAGRARLRSKTAAQNIALGTARGRVRVRSQATAFRTTFAIAHGRTRLRSTATAHRVVSTSATGRVRVRSTASGVRMLVASAHGRLRVRGRATAQQFITGQARGRIRVRSTSSAIRQVLAAGHGRVRVRSQADGVPFVGQLHNATAYGRLRVRSRTGAIAIRLTWPQTNDDAWVVASADAWPQTDGADVWPQTNDDYWPQSSN
jgi:hypothetical protein